MSQRRRVSPVVWLLLPWALVYGAFFVFPFLFSFVLGFLNYNPLNVAHTTFVGLGNVTRIVGDADFHGALRNTLFFVIGTVPVTTTLALALAWLLHAPLPIKDALKAAMFLPSILSVVVIALLFKLFYAPGGALNEGLRAMGLPTHGWLTDPSTALPAIMAMDVWAAVGYYALVLYAAFTSIPESLYEAASLEGAGHWATFKHVTFPMLKPAIGFVLVINTIRSFQVFVEVMLMTQGGPLGSTNTLVMMLYDTAFRRLDYGYASVIAYAVFILSGVFSVFALRRMRAQTPVQNARRAGMMRALRWLVLVAAILLMAYPLAWMITVSLRTPDGLNFRYYTDVWSSGPFTRYFVNSLVVAAIVVTGNILFCTMAAYAFARYRIRGAKLIFFLVLSTIMLPKQVILVPLYIEMQRMGLIDSYWALTLPFLVDPFNIFLIRQYLLGIPTDCEEAARIDGAGEMFILFRVVFPMLTPVLAVVAIHTTLTNWNSFLFPFILTNSTSMRTLPVGLALLSQGAYSIDWGHLMAGAVLSALPVVLAFLIFQRRIIGGLTTGMTR